MNESAKHTLAGLTSPQRLDKALRAAFPEWSRKETDAAINDRRVSVNGKPVWLGSWQVKNGDKLVVADPPAPIERGPTIFDPAWILDDQPALIALNKPAGLLSEPNRWGEGVSLWALAEQHFDAPLTLFHRLDRDTSGVVLFTRSATHPDVNRALDRAFQERTVKKTYLAHVAYPNRLDPAGEIIKPLDEDAHRRDKMRVVRSGGKWAKTTYAVDAPRGDYQPVWLWPETGRTHQLRVHLAGMDAPILGDRLYGDQSSAPRLMLHAHKIQIPHLLDNDEVEFVAPIPPGFGEDNKRIV